MNQGDLENPTLALKLSAIMKQPWNRELLEESLAAETIQRLRGTPLYKTEPVRHTTDTATADARVISPSILDRPSL